MTSLGRSEDNVQQQKSLIIRLLEIRTPNASQRQLPRCADQAGVRQAPVGAVVNFFTSTLGALKQILPVSTPIPNQSHSVVVKASRHVVARSRDRFFSAAQLVVA